MNVVVAHDFGDVDAYAAWSVAAPSSWTILDLPGHGRVPAPASGHYDPMAVATLARWSAIGDAVLVGERMNAHAILTAAAGGTGRGIVIIDGLWGPWVDVRTQIDVWHAAIRAIANDPAATDPPPSGGVDPRIRYDYGIMTSAAFAQHFWAAIDQPVLAIETPRSVTPDGERKDRLSWFAGPTSLVETAAADPSVLVPVIEEWCATLA